MLAEPKGFEENRWHNDCEGNRRVPPIQPGPNTPRWHGGRRSRRTDVKSMQRLKGGGRAQALEKQLPSGEHDNPGASQHKPSRRGRYRCPRALTGGRECNERIKPGTGHDDRRVGQHKPSRRGRCGCPGAVAGRGEHKENNTKQRI
jgi:hypothetical protein